MKKSLNIYHRIVQETDNGFFVVYYLDKTESTYEEIMRIDEDFLHVEGDPASELFVEMEIFSKIQNNLRKGMYLCVSKGHMGSDWYTVDTSEEAEAGAAFKG
ncbi:MAG: hypothetical protein V4492_06505 [Chlamydiota bacterium]